MNVATETPSFANRSPLATPPDPLAVRIAEVEHREVVVTEREKQVVAAIELNHLQQSKLDDNYIKAQIVSEHFICAIDAYKDDPNITEDGRRALESLTIGVFVLRNGFVVTGEGLAESPGNYDSKVGADAARADAMRKIWMVERYAQCNKLAGI